MLEKLCGERAMSRVMLCTTMWDVVDTDLGNKRHAQLCSDLWADMIAQGARTEKHSNHWDRAQANAEAIVGNILKNTMLDTLK